MKNGVGVGRALDSVVQPVLDQPRIRSRRDGAWRGRQALIDFALKPEKVTKPARRALPGQAKGAGLNARCGGIEDMDVDPYILGKGDVLHPNLDIERSAKILAHL